MSTRNLGTATHAKLAQIQHAHVLLYIGTHYERTHSACMHRKLTGGNLHSVFSHCPLPLTTMPGACSRHPSSHLECMLIAVAHAQARHPSKLFRGLPCSTKGAWRAATSATSTTVTTSTTCSASEWFYPSRQEVPVLACAAAMLFEKMPPSCLAATTCSRFVIFSCRSYNQISILSLQSLSYFVLSSMPHTSSW